MAPKSSSASSATRKKHARKSQNAHQPPDHPPSSSAAPPGTSSAQGKSKKDKKAPKIKRYVPPPTFTGDADPVDILKLGLHDSPVHPERAVILRKVGKKDTVTIERGLDEWIAWITTVFKQSQAAPDLAAVESNGPQEVVAATPVLVHHFPRLAAHPSRRVRVLTFTLFNELNSYCYQGDYICRPVLLNLAELEKPAYIGSWMVALWDPDRAVRTVAARTWHELIDSSLEHTETDGKFALRTCDTEILQHLVSLIEVRDEEDSESATLSSALPRKLAILSESSESTSCRLRASAFEALTHLLNIHPKPEELFPAITNSSIGKRRTWESILPSNDQEPPVRKAMWNLIQLLCTSEPCRPLQEALMPVFSSPAVCAAFTERASSVQGSMIGGLVPLLNTYPTLWFPIEEQPASQAAPGDDDNGTILQAQDSPLPQKVSPLTAFYAYLELACSMNPVLLYPALILILASFPISPENVDQFFTHFWAAYQSRPLRSAGIQGSTAFYHAWADCVLFFYQKLSHKAVPLLQTQFGKMWSELSNATLDVEASADTLSSVLCTVLHRSASALEHTWSIVTTSLQDELDATKILRFLRFLSNACLSHAHEPLGAVAQEACQLLSSRVMTKIYQSHNASEEATWIPVLVGMLEKEIAGCEFFDESSRQVLLDFCKDRLPNGVWSGSKHHFDLFLAILRCPTHGIASHAWLAVMDLKHWDVTAVNHGIMSRILGHITELDASFQLPNLGIDQLALKCLARLLEGDETFHAISQSIVLCPHFFVREATIVEMLRLTSMALDEQMKSLLFKPQAFRSDRLCLILSTCSTQLQHSGLTSEILSTLKQIAISSFVLQSLLISFNEDSANLAYKVYTLAFQKMLAPQRSNLFREIFHLLKDCVTDVDCQIHPFDLIGIVRRLLEQNSELKSCDFLCLLPIGNSSDRTLASLLPNRRWSSLLPTMDPLWIPETSEQVPNISLRVEYDRVMLAILDLLAQDRVLAQSFFWLWEHCLYLGQLAQISSSTAAPLTNTEDQLSAHDLAAVVAIVDTNTTCSIAAYAQDLASPWHIDVIAKMQEPQSHISTQTDPLTILLLNLVIATRQKATENLATVALRKVLACLFKYSDSSTDDLESWLAFSRQVESSNPGLCISIICSIKSYLFSNDKLRQYQNRLAGRLTDTPSSKANTDGLHLIEVLCATAPPADSVHVFLPQQRVLFLLQALGAWLRSDDDLETALNARLLELFVHLAPIVQTIMGAHWDQMVDLITINLEEASWEDKESLLLVWQSCLLLKTIQNILKRNHPLQAQIGPQIQSNVKMVLDLFLSVPAQIAMTSTTNPIVQAMEDVLRDPSAHSLYAKAPVNLLVKLVSSPSIKSCVLAFTIARSAIRHLTDNLAIEVELAPEDLKSHSLPAELLEALNVPIYHHPTSALICWLLLLSYFQNASSRLRNTYNSQLRETNLVAEKLLPLLHDVLNVAERGKPKDISIWEIPSFDFSLMEDPAVVPIPLAAYAYYNALRSLPSHIRSWWEGCRNKQLSMNVAGFISRHFSPLLISHELDRIKDPVTLKTLTDENMTIKVSPIIKEVKVTYVVDEEAMEIVVRIPSDFPLQGVEVIDVKKVGVPEATWRAWLLVVQQTIANHNGSIAEALGLFKKNISLHFDGVEACAICYAIISVVDRSLPSKACRTCHNRFHPSCLYKWFSTSHGSSCPLCRSLF